MVEHELTKNDGRGERDPLVSHHETTIITTTTSTSASEADSNPQDLEEAKLRLAKARRLLYISHLFAQFSEIAWQFCLVLFLAAFTNYESLFLVSTFGLTGGLFLLFLGTRAGRFVDGTNRLFAAQRFIWTENVCVVIATILCYMLLGIHVPTGTGGGGGGSSNSEGAIPVPVLAPSRFVGLPHDATSILLLVGIHLLGAIAQVLDRGFLVAIERDWIVVMSYVLGPQLGLLGNARNGNDQTSTVSPQKKWLSETNVAMKQIDLSCKVVAPAISGFIIGAFDNGKSGHRGYDLRGAAVLVGAVNAAALLVEYICTARIYVLIPELAHKETVKVVSNGAAEKKNLTGTQDNSEDQQQAQRVVLEDVELHTQPKSRVLCDWLCRVCPLPDGLDVYLQQSISPGGIGLALLYLNVLTFGGIMTAYLIWRGMRLETVGTWRGISSAVGLLGTVVYHVSAKWLSLESTGMWSICFQFCCISVSFFSLWIHNYHLFLVMFIGGVCLSRVGLWVFDIAITQMMQERVSHDARGVVGGVQQSLNAFFGLFSFALGLVFPDPRQFFIYVGAGYVSVGIATLLFFFGVFVPSRLSIHRHNYESVDNVRVP